MTSEVITILAVSLFSAVVISGLAVFCVIRRYKRKLHSPIYPIENYTSLNLIGASDVLINKNVTRVRVSSSSRRRR